MDKFVTKRNDLLAEQVIKNLKSRQMEGHYVQTKEEALALALELIPEGSSISWGGSMSIKAIDQDGLKSSAVVWFTHTYSKCAESIRKNTLDLHSE